MSFLERLLPASGAYCVATLQPNGGFRHYFCQTVEETEQTIRALDSQGQTVYLAQASFKTPENRKQDNAAYLRNFFFDIDCGPTKDYPDQKTAAAELKAFVAAAGLPFPSVVISGNGLYAHWLLQEDVEAAGWKTFAHVLKETAEAYGFKADRSRTSDSSSVLRPVGSTHRKDPSNPKAVVLVHEAPPVTFDSFVQSLTAAARHKKVSLKPLSPPAPVENVNAEFSAGLEPNAPPAYGEILATRCLQAKAFKAQRGNVAEPVWYGMLGLLACCEDGSVLAQAWSEGHPDYSQIATESKLVQWRDKTTGPPLCTYFGQHHPQGCLGCKFKDKVKSPIQLGRRDPENKPAAVVDLDPPAGFKRAEDGLYKENDGVWTKFYDHDLYPVRLAFDESLGYETCSIRHTLPHEGTLEFTFRSSLVHDPKAFMIVLADNHLKIVGAQEKKFMAQYFEGYMQKLQRQRKMSSLYCQMGWKDRQGQPAFVLGSKIFSPGHVDQAALAKNVPNAAAGFRGQGSLEAWSQATELFNAPDMEPFAFALLAGAFGAPLMKFTGFDGAMVSLVGDSGVGKTLILRLVQSVWGYHNDLMMLKDDTKNALISRLGVYGNLPLTIDEVTNINGEELSDLVYRITQGRDKARLTKASEEKKILNTWNTLAVVTTNSSLAEKLSGAKHDSGAELNRIFEFYVPPHPTFQGRITTDLYWTLDSNFGVAGEVYAQWLVDNTEKIKPALDRLRAMIDTKADVRNEERFWSAVAGVAIYGGLVAQELGLIRFGVSRLIPWVVDCIKSMRGEKTELIGDSISILGQYIDEHSTNRLIVKAASERAVLVIEPPRGALHIRQEIDTMRLFLSRNHFKVWLARRFGSYNKVKTELLADKILRNANLRKTLGQGTQYGGTQQPCWEIDLKNHRLGTVGLQLVQEAEMLAKAPVEVPK